MMLRRSCFTASPHHLPTIDTPGRAGKHAGAPLVPATPILLSIARRVFASAVIVVLPHVAGAQPNVPSIIGTRLAAPLTIDGSIDEPIYEATPPHSRFVQQEPHDGAPATE